MAIYIRCNLCKSKRDLKSNTTVCPICQKNISKTPNKKYRVVVSIAQKRKSQIVSTKVLADKLEANWNFEAELTKSGIELPSKKEEEKKKSHQPILTDIWKAYLQTIITPRQCKKSWKKDLCKWNAFIEPAIGSKRMDEITTEDIEAILDQMYTIKLPNRNGYAESTIKQTLMLIKRLYNWSKAKRKYTGANPTDHIAAIHPDNNRNNALSLKACQQLLRELKSYEEQHPSIARVVQIALLTGRRKREITSLKWENVELTQGHITFRTGKQKKKTTQTLPVSDNVIGILEKQKKQFPCETFVFQEQDTEWLYNAIGRHWKIIRKQAAISGETTFHDLRHTFATIYASSGTGTMTTLKELLGHESLEMTNRYAHLFDKAKKDAVETVAFALK